MLQRIFAAILGTVLVLSAATEVQAGGMEIPDNGTRAVSRGGAFVVRADDLTALAHNPGGLSRFKGTGIHLNNNMVLSTIRFTRAPTSLPDTTPSNYDFDPLATVENQEPFFPLGPMAIFATDFGFEDVTFAFGAYGPSASGTSDYPVSGGQRYMLTRMETLLLYLSLAVAWGKEDHYGIGITLQHAIAPKLKMQMVVDGSPFGALSPYYSGNDVEALVELSDLFAFSALVGAWWRIIPSLEVALSGRIIPVILNATGTIQLGNIPGQTQFAPDRLEITGSSARLRLVLPPTLRTGIRYRYLCDDYELWDIELDLVYEMWSLMDAYHVQTEGEINLFAQAEAPDVVIEKRWRDTVSVRLGGTFNVLPDFLSVSAGGYYETGAIPNNYEGIDFLSFDRFGLGTGLTFTLGSVQLNVAYSHVFQMDREVSEDYGKFYQIRPLDPCPEACDFGGGWAGVVANAGKFESSYDIFSAGIEAAF
jgi:long-subunit fatty acid transport protein